MAGLLQSLRNLSRVRQRKTTQIFRTLYSRVLHLERTLDHATGVILLSLLVVGEERFELIVTRAHNSTVGGRGRRHFRWYHLRYGWRAWSSVLTMVSSKVYLSPAQGLG